MGTDSQKPTSTTSSSSRKTAGSSTSPASSARKTSTSPIRMSAEDKLKKSLKTLSHASGGMSGSIIKDENIKSNTKSSSTKSSSTKSSSTKSSSAKSSAKTYSYEEKGEVRKKVGGVVLDVETIQGATKQKLETRGKRNNVVIIVLSILLIISLGYLLFAIIQYKNGKKPPNLKYLVNGDAKCEWVVEGGKQTEFIIKDGLAPDNVYLLSSELRINTSAPVNIRIEVKVLLEGSPILIAALYDKNDNLKRESDTNNVFIYDGTYTGGGVVHMFEGIDFSKAPYNLTSNNIAIEVVATVNLA